MKHTWLAPGEGSATSLSPEEDQEAKSWRERKAIKPGSGCKMSEAREAEAALSISGEAR